MSSSRIDSACTLQLQPAQAPTVTCDTLRMTSLTQQQPKMNKQTNKQSKWTYFPTVRSSSRGHRRRRDWKICGHCQLLYRLRLHGGTLPHRPQVGHSVPGEGHDHSDRLAGGGFFVPFQTERRGFERHVFPSGRDPGSSHPPAQHLPLLHPHGHLRHHPLGGWGPLCAAPGDAQYGASGCGTSPVS